MYVYEKMTKNPLILTSKDNVTTALDLMKQHGFHRVPVVDDGKLVGLITQGVIEASAPSSATSLSIYEINYLLSKANLGDIMIKDVITIDSSALLEEAAILMREKNIGALPVMDQNVLVGIITHKDIFDAFIDLSGYLQKGVRFVMKIREDKVGVLYEITKCFKDANVPLQSVSIYHKKDGIYVQVQADVNNPIMANALNNLGYDVMDVIDLTKE